MRPLSRLTREARALVRIKQGRLLVVRVLYCLFLSCNMVLLCSCSWVSVCDTVRQLCWTQLSVCHGLFYNSETDGVVKSLEVTVAPFEEFLNKCILKYFL